MIQASELGITDGTDDLVDGTGDSDCASFGLTDIAGGIAIPSD